MTTFLDLGGKPMVLELDDFDRWEIILVQAQIQLGPVAFLALMHGEFWL